MACDMSLGFAEGVRQWLPNAAKIIDKFHMIKHANVILEGLNSIIQHVKTRARGFRNMDYFSTMIYLTRGKLDLNTVTT